MTAVVLTAFAVLLVAPASASIFDTYGFGTRGKGMANALTASARDYHAVYYNPAQLMERSEVHVGLGLTWSEPMLFINRSLPNSPNETVLPGRNVGIHLGVSTPLGGIFQDKLAFGVAFFMPLVRVTRAEFIDASTPHFYMYENLPDKLLILFGMGAKPLEWLKLGLGVQVLADLSGSADVQMSLTDSRITRRRLSIDLNSDLAVTAGITVTPIPGLNLAVSYRQDIDLAFSLPVTAQIEELGVLHFDLAGTSLYSPHQINAGVAWTLPWVPLTVALDMTYALWSLAPSPVPTTTFSLDASAVTGDSTPLIEAASSPRDLGAVDVFMPRIGLEYLVGDFSLRTGYAYRPTALPAPVYDMNFVDTDAHVLTLGADWSFVDPLKVHKKPLTIGLAVQATVLRSRPINKVDPTDVTGSFAAGGAILSIGVDLQHDF
ncbi:MAG: long-subunit fatty acid transport protein [Myxococcota bacterium]|jgi:long-subunit fatty acid transport protein